MTTTPPPTATDWLPPVRRECLRCGTTFTSRELQPRCPRCGFVESPS